MNQLLDKSASRVRRMFATIAPRYDLLNHLLSCQVDRYWRWRAARIARQVRGPLLDVCTGTADLAIALARRTPHDTAVCGVDFCGPMLRLARRKLERLGLEHRIRLVEADALCLPFPDATFGLVTVAFGIRNLEDLDQGLKELRRVCRPEGRLAILEFSQPRRQPWAAIYQWYFRNVLPRVGQWIARNEDRAYEYLPSSVKEFPCGAGLAARLEQAGWRHVTFRPLTGGVATLYQARA
ncbi:MAG: demethylmenaquinone methyltransferase [Pirellulaceae bacterium]|nr:MAG: demethylmenaquinone methyltransferase [Pirellulaceae bacterium]